MIKEPMNILVFLDFLQVSFLIQNMKDDTMSIFLKCSSTLIHLLKMLNFLRDYKCECNIENQRVQTQNFSSINYYFFFS